MHQGLASVHLLNEFVDDGAHGFAAGVCSAPEFFVVGFADVDRDAPSTKLPVLMQPTAAIFPSVFCPVLH